MRAAGRAKSFHNLSDDLKDAYLFGASLIAGRCRDLVRDKL